MFGWLVFGERRAEQSRSSAAPVRAGKPAGRRRQRLSVEALEERLTLTASLGGAIAGGIHAADVFPISPTLGYNVSVTTVATSTNQALHGQTVTLTSTVSPSVPGGPTPTGKVSFYDDSSALIGVANLVNGVATLSTSNTFLVGFNSVNAAYWGDSNYAVSDSGYINVQVAMTPTLTTLATSVTPSSVTFTAKVTPAGPYAGTPTGVVAFFDNGTLVDSVLLVNGRATMTQAMNGSGNHSFTATYYGDSGFSGSQTKAPTVQALATNSAPTKAADSYHTATAIKTVYNAQGKVEGLAFYASVTDTTTGLAATKGTVTFVIDGRAVKVDTVVNGLVGLFVPLLTTKGHTFSAHYTA